MEENLLINPYVSVGEIEFGMKIEDVENLFNKKPDTIYQDYLKRTDARWDNISVKFNKKGFVNELSFVEGKYRAFLNDLDVFDEDIVKRLNKIEKPLNTVGFKVYFEAGVALTGYGKSKEEKTISIFSKELVKVWKK